MADDVIRRIRNKIPTTEDVSSTLLAEIEDELQRQPSAELWILRGDAIQLSDGNFRNLPDAEASYHEALAVDPESADAYESLGYFTYAVKDDARGALPFFQRAIELGAGASAHDGLREALEELAESDE